MPNILFVCGKARKRSPTAADVAAREFGVQTDFAGLSNDADERLGLDQIEWADLILVMEKRQVARLNRQFGGHLKGKKVSCLNIPDNYEFMQPELVALIAEKLSRVLTRDG
ncbi:low molecular weight protein tyrosine phosphatase family protein [Acuticoccus kandeliae]|uniref:low molecular weight protein tyrosine phosphatase family protein n=1 Tax=Acuticoccus kandeliae TaxID=2073160 RepID=UPI000D3E0C91|nr:phosphotyrosine protein phosphatase [Acuticoccus kandeliae]